MYEDNTNNGYQNPYYINKEPNQNLYSLSRVMGILAIVSMAFMTVYLPFIFGSLAIIFGILSKGQEKNYNRSAKMGITLGIIGLAANVVIIGISMYSVFHDPSTYEQFNQSFEQIYGESFEDALNDLQGGSGSSTSNTL